MRGKRSGFLTKQELVERLGRHLGIAIEMSAFVVKDLVGMCMHYKLISPEEASETIPVNVTTMACYLRPYIND